MTILLFLLADNFTQIVKDERGNWKARTTREEGIGFPCISVFEGRSSAHNGLLFLQLPTYLACHNVVH